MPTLPDRDRKPARPCKFESSEHLFGRRIPPASVGCGHASRSHEMPLICVFDARSGQTPPK